MNCKKLFTKPFLFYSYYAVEDNSCTHFYTFDFIHFYTTARASYKYIFKTYDTKYRYFSIEAIYYINLMQYDYHNLFDVFMLIPEIIQIVELSNIIKHNLQLEKHFTIRCDA